MMVGGGWSASEENAGAPFVFRKGTDLVAWAEVSMHIKTPLICVINCLAARKYDILACSYPSYHG